MTRWHRRILKENWLSENREEINQKIERGLAQLDRDEGVSGEVARARLQQRKADWIKNSGRGE